MSSKHVLFRWAYFVTSLYLAGACGQKNPNQPKTAAASTPAARTTTTLDENKRAGSINSQPASNQTVATAQTAMSFDAQANIDPDIKFSTDQLTATIGGTTGGILQGNHLAHAGKLYFEITFDSLSVGDRLAAVGIGQSRTDGNTSSTSSVIIGFSASPSDLTQTGPLMFGSGDTVGLAVDLDSLAVNFIVNDKTVASCTAKDTTLKDGSYCIAGSLLGSDLGFFPQVALSRPGQVTANFGGKPFKYQVPAGYNAGWP